MVIGSIEGRRSSSSTTHLVTLLLVTKKAKFSRLLYKVDGRVNQL